MTVSEFVGDLGRGESVGVCFCLGGIPSNTGTVSGHSFKTHDFTVRVSNDRAMACFDFKMPVECSKFQCPANFWRWRFQRLLLFNGAFRLTLVRSVFILIY